MWIGTGETLAKSVSFILVVSTRIVTLVAMAWAPAAAHAQVIPDPMFHGQWAGPYELAVDLYNGTSYSTSEIAHAALLPPWIVAGTPPSSSSLTRVLLSCAHGTCPGDPQVYGRSYVWSAHRPSLVAQINVPAEYPQDASQDHFCGGHTFLEDGRFLFSNGTDREATCLPPFDFVGHAGAWVLDTLSQTPTWIKAYGLTAPLARWYPTLTLLNDGRVMNHGHSSLPITVPSHAQRRDLLTWDAAGSPPAVWSPTALNDNLASQPTPCAPVAEPLNLFDYPRLHLSRSGELVWTQAVTGGGAPFLPIRTQFMDVRVPDCPPSGLRWRPGGAGSLPEYLHLNGSSVHYITWDKNPAPLGTFKEVIYVIGGADIPVEGNAEDCETALVSDKVEKLVLQSTDAAATATWQPAPALEHARVNHNAVILLDGRMIVIGGVSCDGTGFVPELQPEIYTPPELHDGPPVEGVWNDKPPQSVIRAYHAVAILLPDGRVISLGGRNLGSPLDPDGVSDHSLEIYSPSHVFKPGAPTIDPTLLIDPATGAYPYFEDATPLAASMTFEVTLAPERTVDRVALIRNGSATHAFNPDQRYVELRIIADVPAILPNTRRITVQTPQDGYWAPPGYYLLTVVDNQDVPATAEWIRLEDL